MDSSSVLLWLTFGLLSLSIAAVWITPTPASRHTTWMTLFGAAIVSGVIGNFLSMIAVLELAVFGALAYYVANGEMRKGVRIFLGIITGILALALAMHRLPGFNNPQLLANMRFSADAIAFSQYANFDKAAVGLILLAFLCRRCGTRAEWAAMLRRTLPIAATTAIAVLAIAIAVGFVAPQFKLPPYTPVFLVINLLFTCVAEEAFFRGLLQDRLAAALPATRTWQTAVVLFSGALFGLVHLGGGPVYALLATLCGVGYAYAYAVTKRIEAPIIVHFAFNAIHFIGFTYPAIQPGA
jgi:uncharacterized protein